MSVLAAIAVGQIDRRCLPLFFLGQLLAPELSLGGLALLYLGRQALVAPPRWPWAVALLAGLASPTDSYALELVALLPLARFQRPVAWVAGSVGAWALWSLVP